MRAHARAGWATERREPNNAPGQWHDKPLILLISRQRALMNFCSAQGFASDAVFLGSGISFRTKCEFGGLISRRVVSFCGRIGVRKPLFWYFPWWKCSAVYWLLLNRMAGFSSNKRAKCRATWSRIIEKICPQGMVSG